MIRVRAVWMPVALFAAASCSSGKPDAPGAITADEDRQLNEAAAMLDDNSIDLNAVATPNESNDPQ